MPRKTVRPLGADPIELIKYLASQQVRQIHVSSIGEITSVDPASYTAKVMLYPGGAETGWLPICTPYGGPGWGFAALPPLGALHPTNVPFSCFHSPRGIKVISPSSPTERPGHSG